MSLHLGGLRARHERRGHPRRRRRRHGGSPRRQAGHRPRHPRCSLEHKEQPVTRQWTFTSESVTEAHPDKTPEPGRASCRERVCPYVYLPAVPLPSKQKPTPLHTPPPPPPPP